MHKYPSHRKQTALAHKLKVRLSVRRFFALGMLLLGFAVVCWGLHDKLSLYATHGVTPPVAKAKLLTESERSVPVTMPAVPQPIEPLLLALFTLALVSLSRAHARDDRKEPELVPCTAPPFPEILQRRPPPAW